MVFDLYEEEGFGEGGSVDGVGWEREEEGVGVVVAMETSGDFCNSFSSY